MKIQTKKLTLFLKKFRMSGLQTIKEAIFKFEDDGLKIFANDAPKHVRVRSWLKKSAFKEYEALGNVGLNDLENVTKVLGRFGEELTLKKEGNLVTVSGNGKTVDIELVSEDFLDNDITEPTLEFDETFAIPSTKLKDVFTDTLMNKDAILSITTEDKKVIFSNTGKYKFKTLFPAITCKGGTFVKFGEPLINALSNLDGTLDMSIKSDYPTRITEKTDDSVITLIIAPRVED